MILESIMALGGLVVPPAVDFLKKKFLGPNTDTPAATLSALATTKPELMGGFVSAQSELYKAMSIFFNRDVISAPSMWVVNLRASIRPLFVVFSLGMRYSAWVFNLPIDPAFCGMMDMCITSWFGSRI